MEKKDMEKIMKEMRAGMRPELFEHPEKYIPRGIYCEHVAGDEFYEKLLSGNWPEVTAYGIPNQKDIIRYYYKRSTFYLCPFWVYIGPYLAYCQYLQISDFDLGLTPLWDGVKVCEVNYEAPRRSNPGCKKDKK